MMKKERGVGHSIKLSALRELDPSTLPTKTLELGTKIVQDLGLGHSVDTLSRWMSHHLAEKMVSLETLTGEEKNKVEKEVIELIDKLWLDRHNWPGGIAPLNQYNELRAVLNRLGANSSPFQSNRPDEAEKLLATIFFGLKQTVINGAILLSDNRKLPKDFNASLDVFDEDERQYIESIKSWIEFSIRRPTDKSSFEFFVEGVEEMKGKEAEEVSEDKIVEIISTDVDRLIEDLQELKVMFSKRFSDTG